MADATERVADATERKERIMQATQQQTLRGPRSALPVLMLGVVFVTGTIVGIALSTWVPAISIPSVSTPAGDRSYDAIEDARATGGVWAPAGDRSYDAIEDSRATRAVAVSASEPSYDAVEHALALQRLR